MITYNRQSLDNLDLQQQAREAFEKGLITPEEYDRIRAAYPYDLYLPNFFVRIGLFILTVIAAACGLGLFLIAGASGGEKALSITTIIFGVITYIVLEVFIHNRKMFGSGVDDALLWIATLLLALGIISLKDPYPAPASRCAIVLVITLIGTVRYADQAMALVAYGSFFGVVFYGVSTWGPVARALLPFLLIVLSVGCYFLFTLLQKSHGFRHYRACLQVLRVAALLSLYAAGNYYIVREANAMLSGHSGPIALGWLWWGLTAGIPIFYIIKGIRNKDVLFLWTGMALVAGTVLTVRYYYHLLPAELAMIIGGIILIAGVYGVTRYLRTPRSGFTATAPAHPHLLENLPVEGLIIAESFSVVTTPIAGTGTHFGGGDTGGGGAGGNY